MSIVDNVYCIVKYPSDKFSLDFGSRKFCFHGELLLIYEITRNLAFSFGYQELRTNFYTNL